MSASNEGRGGHLVTKGQSSASIGGGYAKETSERETEVWR